MDAIMEKNQIKLKKGKAFSFFKIIKNIFNFISKIILYFLFVILIIVSILFLLYFVDMTYNLKQGVYKPPLFNSYIIVSPSMEPTINVSDAIVIKRESAKSLKIGDIITFNSTDPRYSGITITHRIVDIEKSQEGDLLFRTKGDNNNSVDMSYTKASDIYGKVILKIPKLGYVQYFLSQSYGWLLFIVIPCLSIISYDIVKLLKKVGISVFRKNDKKDNNDDDKKIEELNENSSEENVKNEEIKEIEMLDYEEDSDEKK